MAGDDLTLFVEACREFDQQVSIRGSTAYMLSRKAESESIANGSIVDSVPPLGDLDLIVRDKQPSEAMRRMSDVLERYKTYVPASRFIHIDVFYKHLPVRRDSPLGNVVLSNLPEVTIGFDKRQGDEWTASVFSRDRQVQAEVIPRVRATLFRDFLFLLRLSQRHPELNAATREVAALLRLDEPRTIGLATRQEGGVRELARIDKALVKHVLLQNPEFESTPMTEYLPRRWLTRFSTHVNGLSQRIIRSETLWRQTPAIAYAVDGRVMTFAAVTSLDVEEQRMLEEKLALEPDSFGQRLTPSLKVTLPYPDDPECCDYSDFSKGISELVFRDPTISRLLNVALMEGRERYYAVHAQAGEGFGARSLRTDPGFMGMLNHGSLGTVRLLGVKNQ